MNKARAWKIGAAAIVVVGAFGGWQAWQGRQHTPGAVAHASAPKSQAIVELAATDVVKAEPRELLRGLPISGSLRAVDSAVVKARVAGELQGLALREGDAVQGGQVIARIDPTETQARLKQAREQADSARAQIEIAQRQWSNNKSLVDQGFISRTALDTSWHNFVSAEANHKAALAAVDMAKKSVDDTILKAPIGGVVSQRFAQPGERVGIDGRVVEIVDLKRLELEATLSAGDSIDVRVGQEATLQVEGSTRTIAAKVARINPSAQAGSRSVLVYLAIQDASGLRQGLFAQGALGTGKGASLAVPLAAVRTDKPSPYVQLVENDQVVHKAVQPGARGNAGRETWVAVEGIPSGATVIKGHVGALREGTPVKFTAAPRP